VLDGDRLSTVAVHCKVYSVDFGPGTLGCPTGATTPSMFSASCRWRRSPWLGR
jgi:hypothetical protein